MPPGSTTTSTTIPFTRVAGGGKAKTDCYVELAVVGEPAVLKDRKVECQDGDPACDLDGDPCNASCRFGVALCLNDARDVATCQPPYPPDALVNVITRKAATVLDVPPLDSVGCGVVSELDVPLRVRRGGRVVKPGRAKLKVVAVSPTRPKRDKDKVTLTCLPPPPGCSQ